MRILLACALSIPLDPPNIGPGNSRWCSRRTAPQRYAGRNPRNLPAREESMPLGFLLSRQLGHQPSHRSHQRHRGRTGQFIAAGTGAALFWDGGCGRAERKVKRYVARFFSPSPHRLGRPAQQPLLSAVFREGRTTALWRVKGELRLPSIGGLTSPRWRVEIFAANETQQLR